MPGDPSRFQIADRKIEGVERHCFQRDGVLEGFCGGERPFRQIGPQTFGPLAVARVMEIPRVPGLQPRQFDVTAPQRHVIGQARSGRIDRNLRHLIPPRLAVGWGDEPPRRAPPRPRPDR